MSPIRRDGEGRPQVGPTWESLIDRQIREAMADGQFENLPYQGERIPIDDDGSEWALAHHILKQSGFVPGWIATDLEIRQRLAELDTLIEQARRRSIGARQRDRGAVVDLVGRINKLVLRLEHEAPTPRQHRHRLDLDVELARLEGEPG